MALSICDRNSFGPESLRVTQSIQQAMFDRKKYELITTSEIDDLLEKIKGCVDEALAKSSPEENRKLEQDLSLPRFILESCREMVFKFEPQRLAEALIQKPRFGQSLNLAYDTHFQLICPASDNSRLPRIGSYGKEYIIFSVSLLFMRIHPLFLDQVPSSIKNALRDKQNNKCDFIFNASYAKPVEDVARAEGNYPRYNLNTHSWVHPRAQKGQESKKFPNMGIFEPLGVAQVLGNDGVAFNSLKPMEVYIHPVNGGAMGLSPNNAHFTVIEGSPFSAFWHVTVCEERTVIANEWLINDSDHPFSALIVKSFAIRGPQCVKDHLNILKSEKTIAIKEATDRLENIAKAFEENKPEAMALFEKLSEGEKNRVYYLTWISMGEKKGIHVDFGKASFRGAKDLRSEYHCAPSQKAQVIRTLLQEQVVSFNKLIQGQEALFSTPTTYPHLSPERMHKEKVLKPILEKFKDGNVNAAMEQFLMLPEFDKNKIFEMAWDLKQCPPRSIHSDFGRASFLRSSNLDQKYHCTDSNRLDVLILYLNH